MAVKIDESKCVGCSACVGTCPVEALEMVEDKAKVNEDICIDCGACIGSCPTEAISA